MVSPDEAGQAPDEPPARRHQSARIEVLATLAITLGLLGVIASRGIRRRFGPHPTPQQCAAMLTRYAEHEARAADLSERPPRRIDPEQGDDATARSATTPDAARCARELTVEEVDCAMKSNNADELERCLP